MTPANLALILGSAVVHVAAHVALKTARDRTAFVWWMLLWGGVLFAPVLLVLAEPIAPFTWGLMAVSAACEALYFVSIARAYQHADLSVVYPLARGAAPLFLVIWSTLFIGDRPTAAGLLGILLIALGLYLLNLPRLSAWRAPLQALRQAGPRLALFAGLCISLYTVIDRVGITRLNPLLYTYLALWLTVLLMTPYTLRAVGWAGLRAELRSSRFNSLVAGFTTLAAYALVLFAIRAGVPVSYAGAMREISVVFGIVAGYWLLKEQGGPMRLVGGAAVAGGVALIALLG
ncbi:MAG: EamA family transporter [Anaerolineales bacterium]|nr:EamA family transporter [Anaerolineales bacterium]